MRLIHARTLELHEFVSESPPYAILSHRWGPEEVGYKDFVKKRVTSGAGYRKIEACCSLALSRHLEWVWIDTCCIDKRSSSELSEAINSMFRWYEQAEECYAYLADIDVEDCRGSEPAQALAKSDWFYRGWTLQELIAPQQVLFMDRHWQNLGQRSHHFLVWIFGHNVRHDASDPSSPLWNDPSSPLWTDDAMTHALSQITGVQMDVLAPRQPPRELLGRTSIATKMTWMAGRKTSRIEDRAYCMLGIFDINMPLLYGEGERAFERLQMELLRDSDDETIFAWNRFYRAEALLLAPSQRLPPINCADKKFWTSQMWHPVERARLFDRTPYAITNAGLQFTINLERGMYHFVDDDDDRETIIIALNCRAIQPSDRYLCFLTIKRLSCGHYACVSTIVTQVEEVIPVEHREAILRWSEGSGTLVTAWRKPESPLESTGTEFQQPFNVYIHFGPRQHEACDCAIELVEL